MKKFMKRKIATVLALLMLLTTIPVQNVQAEEYQSDILNQKDFQEQTDISDIENLLLDYLVVEQPNIQAPQTQNIVVGFNNSLEIVNQAILKLTNINTGEETDITSSDITDSAIRFAIDYKDNTISGKFQVTSIIVSDGITEKIILMSETGIDAVYGVNSEVDTKPDAYVVDDDLQSEITVDNVDEDGNLKNASSLEDALSEAQAQQASEASAEGAEDGIALYSEARNSNVVVVLDPGHGGNDPGTSYTVNGTYLCERDINLKIAQYCKAELERYTGVTVYMTRTDNTSANTDREQRAKFAKDHGAHVLVSIHINSASNANAHGAEVYYPNVNYNSNISTWGKELGNSILNQLAQLGLTNRGTKIKDSTDGETYPDGSIADYYGINKYCKQYGFPGIIVEHAFITNTSDASNHLMNDGQLKQLGIADATGIANYFGLKKGLITGIYATEQTDGIHAGAVKDVDNNTMKYRWMVYDLQQQNWSIISDWNSSEWVTWKPNEGNYWLRVEAVDSNGNTGDYTIAYNVKKNYLQAYLKINGIYCIENNNGIQAGAVHQVKASNVQYRWLVYDLYRQNWRVISNWNSSEWVTWKPEPGNYWLRVEARANGELTSDNTIAYNVNKDYTAVAVYGIMTENKDDCVKSTLSYQSYASKTEFRWMSYDLQKGKWVVLSNWSNTSSINWKPQKSTFWLSVDIRTGEGAYKNSTITYTSVHDYTQLYMDINGIYCIDGKNGVDVGVVHETNDQSAQYRWLYYNVDKNSWYMLKDWNASEWATWKPDAGNYWLRAEAKTKDGKEYNYTITYTVEKYAIMGNTQTTREQMVNYFKANSQYPIFYANTDAPTIEHFCQIYLEEAAAEGVKAEVAFSQCMKETGFLRFQGDVAISQFNFAGLGATGNQAHGASFSNVRTGVRAQIQHLKAYASKEKLNNACVDPRFEYITPRESAIYVEWLGQHENPQGKGWATATDYGYSIRRDYINKLKQF